MNDEEMGFDHRGKKNSSSSENPESRPDKPWSDLGCHSSTDT